MRMFINRHPFIALIMVGLICTAVVETADIIVNKKDRKIKLKNSQEEDIESLEE